MGENIPKPSPEEQIKSTREAAAEHEYQNVKSAILTFDDVQEILFGEPTKLDNFLKDSWARLQINEGHKNLQRLAIMRTRKLAKKMIEAMEAREKAKDSTRQTTLEELAKLRQRIAEYFVLMGKTLNKDDRYGDGKGPIQTADLLAIESHIADLESLKNTDELLDIVQCNQTFVQMLTEQVYPAALLDKNGGKRFASLDPQHPEYHKNIEKLYCFIAGTRGKENDGQSRFRKLAEGNLWMEIVRTMDCRQKEDLMKHFLEKSPPEDTKKFVRELLISGATDRRELLDMYEHGTLSSLGTKDEFDRMLKDSVGAKDVLETRIKEEVRRIKNPGIANAAEYFFSFHRMAAETIARCGALSAVFTTFLRIMDKINETSDKTVGSVAKAIGSGFKEAVKMPHVIGGTAVAIWGSDVIYPWVKEWVHSPSDAEREQIGRTREERFLREVAGNRHETLEYFIAHYEGFAKKAEKNAREPEDENEPEKKKSKIKKQSGVVELYPGDIKMTSEEAGQLGFEKKEMAEAMMHKLFNITYKVLNLKKPEDLHRYLEQKKLLPETHHSFS